ncbi:hypothetical protein TNCT_139851 [Trichonephila clavata]|uniref:Uncharacterized protein n=1 Tax=Trichonephila clavata TaxID=2740835 RepID=A0A8X6HGK2_TRICU|nr:hypothetical protein TNCT_139851 [Trichonephila clavata]
MDRRKKTSNLQRNFYERMSTLCVPCLNQQRKRVFKSLNVSSEMKSQSKQDNSVAPCFQGSVTGKKTSWWHHSLQCQAINRRVPANTFSVKRLSSQRFLRAELLKEKTPSFKYTRLHLFIYFEEFTTGNIKFLGELWHQSLGIIICWSCEFSC